MSRTNPVAHPTLAAALLCAGLTACMRPSPVTDYAVAVPTVAANIERERDPCAAITEDIVEQGRKVFNGPGNCYSCHGPKAKGTPLAPDLTDQKWLQIDGSYPGIVSLIRTGVPKPKEHPAPMLPMGGAQLSDAQVCAVGAYVFTLTHPLKEST